jgi:ketose-bisphosphate aldolase
MNKAAALAERLRLARQTRTPLLAFNVVDLSSMQGVIDATAAAGGSVIIQVSARTVGEYGAGVLVACHRALRAASGIASYLHLDHCDNEDIIAQAVATGFDGIMVDGSHRPFDENVALTRKWAEAGHRAGLVVEGEIGPILGSEDGFENRTEGRADAGTYARFADLTGVDLLGSPIGTAHGLYAEPPALDFPFVTQVRDCAPGFVVHGGSGLDETTLRRLAECGVAKINFSTELKIAWSEAVRGAVALQAVPEPLRALQDARRKVAELVRSKRGMIGGGV